MSLAAEEILELSEQVLRSSNKVKGIEAEMVTAIALIESSGNVKAYRYEEHLGEASSGLTQLLQSTAKWLAEDLSYDEYELDLYQPASSLYFCAAYLCWLKTYKSVTRSDEFVVRGYNGGPNGVNLEATVPYWNKYKQALETVLSLGTQGAKKQRVICPGDTFYGIAKDLGIALEDLLAANAGVDPTKLVVGQAINLP